MSSPRGELVAEVVRQKARRSNDRPPATRLVVGGRYIDALCLELGQLRNSDGRPEPRGNLRGGKLLGLRIEFEAGVDLFEVR